MRQDLTDITIVLDRSGSMVAVRDDTIGGFNVFIEEQKKANGECLLTLNQFDDIFETVHRAIPIPKVPALNISSYVPRGSTALLDAVGRSIDETGKRLEAMPENERPGKVIVVIMTDGHENASTDFTRAKVQEKVSHQRDAYGWEFIFLGANIDSFAEADSMGIGASSTANYSHTGAGVVAAVLCTSQNVTAYRNSNDAKDLQYSQEQRKRMVSSKKK